MKIEFSSIDDLVEFLTWIIAIRNGVEYETVSKSIVGRDTLVRALSARKKAKARQKPSSARQRASRKKTSSRDFNLGC